MPRLKGPFPYMGGKCHLVKKLLPYVPKHRYYIEAFGGAGNLLLAKEPAEFEVFNDIDHDIVNFFKVLVDEGKFQRFYRKVLLAPYSRHFWKFCKQTYETCNDEVERAFRWFIVACQSFGGMHSTWGYSIFKTYRGYPESISRFFSRIELLPQIHARLQRVIIEERHWKDLLEAFSGYEFEEEFIYLDPPLSSHYQTEWGIQA